MDDLLQSVEQSAPDQSVRKQLNRMFSRYNYVGVKNILKEEFAWPVALEQNEIIDFSQGDPMNEERMAQSSSGTFLPGEAAVKQKQKLVKVILKAGETRMIVGEAAYVVVPRIFNALVRERFGTTKSGLARLRNPQTQKELLAEIVVGPKINNVGEAMQTFVDEKLSTLNKEFSDVQAEPPKTRVKNAEAKQSA